SGHPSAAGLEKCDAKLWKTITDAAHYQAGRGRHHLKRMCYQVPNRESFGEAVETERRLPAFRAAVDPDGKIHLLCGSPQRIVGWIMQHAAIVRIGANKPAAEA